MTREPDPARRHPMTIDPRRLLDWSFPETEVDWTAHATQLYALTLGLGADPLDEGQLRFVHEDGLQALPSMALVLGWPGLWFADPATGIDAANVVNAGQHVRLARPVPAAGTVRSRTRVVGVEDKGVARGALVHLERELRGGDGVLIGHVDSSLLCRRNGGCGSAGQARAPGAAPPARPPDGTHDWPTLRQAALLYRLNGDLHPLHALPAAARAAGFDRPILHGLCALGMVGYTLMHALCRDDPARLVAFGGRFSGPIYPGETLQVDHWLDDAVRVRFRVRVAGRDATAIDQGSAELERRGVPGNGPGTR